MAKTAQAVFQIKSSHETPFGEAPEGPALIRSHFMLAYQGDLQGEGTLEELKISFNSKRARMYGLQRFTGCLGDMSGSFVLKHTGRFVNGVVSSTQTVVPGSATGTFKGLRGEMSLQSAAAKEFPVTFRYYFA